MNQITREQAFDLAKYRYKLVDKRGKIIPILAVYETNEFGVSLFGDESKINDYIDFEDIGKDYFILCRDLSQLTETIEDEWGSFVPFIELENEFRKPGWLVDLKFNVETKEAHFENKVLGGMHGITPDFFDTLRQWHFNLGFPQETVKPL